MGQRLVERRAESGGVDNKPGAISVARVQEERPDGLIQCQFRTCLAPGTNKNPLGMEEDYRSGEGV